MTEKPKNPHYDFFQNDGGEDTERMEFSESQQAWHSTPFLKYPKKWEYEEGSFGWATIYERIHPYDFKFFLAYVKRKNPNAELKTADLLEAKKELESIKKNLQEIKATGWAGLMGRVKK